MYPQIKYILSKTNCQGFTACRVLRLEGVWGYFSFHAQADSPFTKPKVAQGLAPFIYQFTLFEKSRLFQESVNYLLCFMKGAQGFSQKKF